MRWIVDGGRGMAMGVIVDREIVLICISITSLDALLVSLALSLSVSLYL